MALVYGFLGQNQCQRVLCLRVLRVYMLNSTCAWDKWQTDIVHKECGLDKNALCAGSKL